MGWETAGNSIDNALRVARAVAPGYYADGGLYFQISASGSRSWIFRLTMAKRAREMSLGGLSTVSLAQARTEAAQCRKLLAERVDPIEARKAAEDATRRACARDTGTTLFCVCAAGYMESQIQGWKNKKYAQQWANTLSTYAFPFIGTTDVADIDTAAPRTAIFSRAPRGGVRCRTWPCSLCLSG